MVTQTHCWGTLKPLIWPPLLCTALPPAAFFFLFNACVCSDPSIHLQVTKGLCVTRANMTEKLAPSLRPRPHRPLLFTSFPPGMGIPQSSDFGSIFLSKQFPLVSSFTPISLNTSSVLTTYKFVPVASPLLSSKIIPNC
jgi:hypothetical protein